MTDLEIKAADWPKFTLGDICTFKGGDGFRENLQGRSSGDFPFIKVSDLMLDGNKKHLVNAQNWVTKLELHQLRATLHPRGAVVFAKVGAALKLNRRRILTRPTAIDNNMMVAIPDLDQINPDFLYFFLSIQDLGRFSQEGAVPSVNQRHLSLIPINLPPLSEQHKITDILKTWDEAIEKLAALYATKARQLKGLTTRLIHRARIEPQQVGRHLFEVSTRNCNQHIKHVLSVTNSAGFIPAKDQFAHRVASADLSNYKVVQRGQYAYNPSRINVGSIARLDDHEVGVLSPMYVVFRILDTLDSDYFGHWLRSAEARKRIATTAQGSVRHTVSFTDLCSILIPLPPPSEQLSIAHVLNTAVNEMSLLDQEIKALDRQKGGLMRKLLMGEWRTTVENR